MSVSDDVEGFSWTSAEIDTITAAGYARKSTPAGHHIAAVESCRDCGAVPTETGHFNHAKGCLTVEVEQGRMTPRERQIERLEARERAEADWQDASVAERLDARLDQAMLTSGKRPTQLAVSPGDFTRLLRDLGTRDSVRFDAAANPVEAHARYKGADIVRDPALQDGQVIAISDPLIYGDPVVTFDGFDPGKAAYANLGAATRMASAAISNFSISLT